MNITAFLFLVVGQLLAVENVEFTPNGERILTDLLWSSNSWDIPAELLVAQSYEESRHNPFAQSPTRSDGYYDTGWSQIHTKYVDGFAEELEDLYGIALSLEDRRTLNIVLGAFILHRLEKTYGTWERGLIGYNAGPVAAKENKPPVSTVGYVNRIRVNLDPVRFYGEVLPSFLSAVLHYKNGDKIPKTQMIMWVSLLRQSHEPGRLIRLRGIQ